MTKLAFYHGYELTGSGSNEYTRYLAQAVARLGHEVVIVCSEPHPEAHPYVSRAFELDAETGEGRELFRRDNDLPAPVTVYRLARTSIYPVYITDQQRPPHTRAFTELTDEQLDEYERACVAGLSWVLQRERPRALHANHLVYQPRVAAIAARATSTPYYVVPHGSAIEYTVKRDERFVRAARDGIAACAGIGWTADEIRERVHALLPDMQDVLAARGFHTGVGTDTSLFGPLDDGLQAALSRLSKMQRPGGKTPAQREELRQRLDRGEPPEIVVDYREAYDHSVEDADFAAQLSRIPFGGDVILFVGSLTHGKGVQSAIAALPLLLVQRPNAHLVVVGAGSYREVLEALTHALASGADALRDHLVARGPELERATTETLRQADPNASAATATAAAGPATSREVARMEDLALLSRDSAAQRALAENGALLAERVHFVGRLDHERLRLLFPCCRVAVFPSVVSECAPMVLREALASGVLPVVFYHSGLRALLDELRADLPPLLWDALCVEPAADTRIAQLARQLATVLAAAESLDLRPELRRIAVERYDWRVVAQRLLEVAEQL